MTRRTGIVLLALNILGSAAYIAAATPSWVIPQERQMGLHSITGEPFIWAIGVLPIFAVFTVLNLIWGVVILTKRQWWAGRLWLLTATAWLIAISIDFAHH